MGNRHMYSDEYRQDIINRYLQSGLTPYRFSQLPDVSVPPVTIKTWVNSHLGITNKKPKTPRKKTSPKNLNIVCYSIGDDDVKETATLEEMIKFRSDVHNCCIHLYQMECSKKNIALLSQIMEAL